MEVFSVWARLLGGGAFTLAPDGHLLFANS